jgi:hypothetical protein
LKFQNGSIINFSYAENLVDASRILGGEYQAFYIDEASLMMPAVIQHIEERLRSGNKLVPVIGLRLACVDEGDVLTADGWKTIQNVGIGEMVYSVNKNGVMELKEVLDVYLSPYKGEMVRVNKKGLYMSMTPDHRVVYQTRERNGEDRRYEITPWDKHTSKSLDLARAPRSYMAGTGYPSPIEGWSDDLYISYLGLFLAEGCTNATVRRSNYKVVVTQCKRPNQDIVKELMEKLPVNYSLSANGDFQITEKSLWEHFSQFGKANDKFVPREVLNSATQEQLKLLLQWMVFGDGHVRNGSIQYVTVSKQLADDVAEIGLKLGYKVSISHKALSNSNHRDRYTVYLTSHKQPVNRIEKEGPRNDTSVENFDGWVYCIKVADNENFVLRQRGTVWLSGNTNPGGIGHKYLKDRFVNPTKRGKIRHVEKIEGTKLTRTVAFIPAKASDNPHINEGYDAVLNSIPDPQRRAAMRDGDWDAMVGQFFEQWQYSKHVVRSFPVPKEWARYAGVDWGFRDPFAVVWVAVDNDRRMWVYREICVSGVQNTDQAKIILETERGAGENEVMRVADPSMWGSRGTPLSIADQYGQEGCGIMPANNDRTIGWSLVHQYLGDGPACEIHKLEGKKTCPMLHVFEDKCPLFIEQIPALPRSTSKPDDCETRNVDDHIADALRYVCMYAGNFARPIFYDEGPVFRTGVPSTMAVAEEEEAKSMPLPNFGGKFVGDLGLSPF